MTTMRVLGSEDVDALVSVELAMDAARAAAAAAAAHSVLSGRVQVTGEVSWMRILAGMVTDLDLLGYKEFHRVGKHVRYHVHLFRESTGEPCGIVDGRRITSLRTAATAAVAAQHWAAHRGAPHAVGVIGSGEEAREGLRVLAGALEISGVRVYSPTPANREAFAAEMSEEIGVGVEPSSDVEAALRVADVGYIATSSKQTPFLGDEVTGRLGLLLAIGATRPEHRELEGSVFLRATTVVVDCLDALQEAGDCVAASREGFDASTAVLLGDYLKRAPGAGAGSVLFKSVGSVEQDLILAHYLLREAERTGIGRAVDGIASLRVMR
jgi:alanine dehydrogenase